MLVDHPRGEQGEGCCHRGGNGIAGEPPYRHAGKGRGDSLDRADTEPQPGDRVLHNQQGGPHHEHDGWLGDHHISIEVVTAYEQPGGERVDALGVVPVVEVSPEVQQRQRDEQRPSTCQGSQPTLRGRGRHRPRS